MLVQVAVQALLYCLHPLLEPLDTSRYGLARVHRICTRGQFICQLLYRLRHVVGLLVGKLAHDARATRHLGK